MRKSSGNLRIFVYSVILVFLWSLSIFLNMGLVPVSARTSALSPTPTPSPTASCYGQQSTPCPPPICPHCVTIHDWVVDPGAIQASPQNNYEFDVFNALSVNAVILDSNKKVVAVIQPNTTWVAHLPGPGTFSFFLAGTSAMFTVTGVPIRG